MRIIAVVFGECNAILLAFYSHHSEKVERFPPKQVHQSICCVIPGKRTLDPGSSLLETTSQPRNKPPPDPKKRVIPGSRGPRRIGNDPVGQRPGIQWPGVAKSVCHRDRRSLPNRQLRCLCRTDFGSPARKQTSPGYLPHRHTVFLKSKKKIDI